MADTAGGARRCGLASPRASAPGVQHERAPGTLPNDGSPFTLHFPAKATTSLRLTIRGVSAYTVNIGLSEIEAWSL